MSEPAPGANRLVVMLTADRQIDRRITLEADSLEAAGWQVLIVGMPLDGGQDHDARVVRIGGAAGTARRENLVLAAYRWLRGCLPMNGAVMRWLKRMAWRYVVDQESFYTRLFLATALRYSPRVIVAHDLPMLPVAAKAARACGARLVYDSHELYSEQEFSEHERRNWAQIEARYIGACDVVITVNHSIAWELRRRYGLRDVQVICNAVPSLPVPAPNRRFHELFRLAPEKKVLLLQGGLSGGRNLEGLVAAMRYVRNPAVVLVILGDGVLSRRLGDRVAKDGLGQRVILKPAVPQAELLGLTTAADGGVIPYQATCLNNFYCTPNKLFEFVAAGVPILASDLPELRAMVHDRDIGMVGDMTAPQQIAGLIDSFFAEQERHARWRANLARVRSEVCWEVEGRKLVQLYGGLQ